MPDVKEKLGCAVCGARIYKCNKTGLCAKHSKSIRGKRYYAKNKERLAPSIRAYRAKTVEYRQQYRRTPKARWNLGRSVAKGRKMEWSIDFEYFQQLLAMGCFYCGTDLADSGGYSLDRVDNTGGYTQDNVLPCCAKCNRLRMDDYTVYETMMMVAVLRILERKRNGGSVKADEG